MSFNTQGMDELKLQLQRLRDVSIVANAELKKCAGEIADLARKMAPIDEGNLEKAIKVRYEGVDRNALGQFVKGGGAYTIYVDNDMPVDGRDGKTVGDYAWIMHEHLTPAGDMNLGPKSEEKQASQSIQVGGKFLERASEAMRDGIYSRLANIVHKYVEAIDIE
jgi:hypothetical protein